ncbi:MAG: hypothetical protein HQ581_26705 [Planctomycetes bacterium]|nr:hypothetical protein [Planctomycetota bacterium]
MKRNGSVHDFQIAGRYENLRKVLSDDQYVDHVEKPLAFWALPTDRRLPLALMGQTLKELLATPFTEISETPGIGLKKMHSFVSLLTRAANTDRSELPTDFVKVSGNGKTSSGNGTSTNGNGNGSAFQPTTVSEVVWAQWQATVIRHGLGKETLGRFAPSLRNITRVVWNTPLEAYTERTLAEIREMKTHGEKRVHGILEVFHSVHAIFSQIGHMDHLALRIVPRWIDRIEQWIAPQLQTPGAEDTEALFENFVGPLLEQVRVDAVPQLVSLAENRLGIHEPITSVRQAARTMGLTRARVYQLLNEINDIMMTRWPNGRHLVYALRDKYGKETAEMKNPPELTQFHAAIELFYPSNRRGAAGPLEFVEDPADAA